MACGAAIWQAMGGFTTVKDVLAEDFALGKYVRCLLRKRVVLARRPSKIFRAKRNVGNFTIATVAGRSCIAK